MTTENDYLELATDAQKRYNDMALKIKSKDDELFRIKKELISCYGYIRILANVYESQGEGEPTICMMIEVLYEFMSQFAEENIFN